MQYDDFSVDEPPTWGAPSPRDGGGDLGLVRETLRKEQVINFARGSQGYAGQSAISAKGDR